MSTRTGKLTQLSARQDAGRLLQAAGLPHEDLETAGVQLIGAYDAGVLVGVAGLQQAGKGALLRSLAVSPGRSRRGLGTRLVSEIETLAVDQGIEELWLLTETAAEFFVRRGYRSESRALAPPAIQDTGEFTSICPASAVCMMRRLTGTH